MALTNFLSQMSGLTMQLIKGDSRAAQFVKSLSTNPAILRAAPFLYIPLEVETCTQHSDAEVSESLVITSEGKKFVADNIAPGPWSWQLSGYIPGAEIGELTNYYTPGLRHNVELIKKIYREGQIFTFRDPDCWTYENVIIQSLDLDTQKDCKNKKPFTMTLKQIEVLNASNALITALQVASEPSPGTAAGLTTETGEVSTQAVPRDSFATSIIEKFGIQIDYQPRN